MSDLQNNNQISEDVSGKPTLCPGCLVFFGTKQTNGLCSKCFKDTNKTLQKDVPIKKEIIQEPIIKEPETKIIPEEVKSEEKVEAPKKEAPNPNKCATCSKKTGVLGFGCKCGLNFCKNHRLPEEHECSFDHKGVGKDKLTKDNPLIQASKLDKI